MPENWYEIEYLPRSELYEQLTSGTAQALSAAGTTVAFKPGQKLKGSATWTVDPAPHRVEVRLFLVHVRCSAHTGGNCEPFRHQKREGSPFRHLRIHHAARAVEFCRPAGHASLGRGSGFIPVPGKRHHSDYAQPERLPNQSVSPGRTRSRMAGDVGTCKPFELKGPDRRPQFSVAKDLLKPYDPGVLYSVVVRVWRV